MGVASELNRLSYSEHWVVNRLMHSHLDEFGDNLKAMAVFGDIITLGGTFDIDLLEVIDGWAEPSVAEFESSEELQMRGKLRLYIVPLKHFEKPLEIKDDEVRDWVLGVHAQLRLGYQSIFEPSYGFVEATLRAVHREMTMPKLPSRLSANFTSNPFKLKK